MIPDCANNAGLKFLLNLAVRTYNKTFWVEPESWNWQGIYLADHFCHKESGYDVASQTPL
jgi:hypothetical protein